MTKEDLIQRSKPFFINKKGLVSMLATEDGNFFYPENRRAAQNHSKNNKKALFEIKRTDVFPPIKKVAETVETATKKRTSKAKK